MDLDIYTKRDEQNRVKLSFYAEDTLRQVLGAQYDHCHGVRLKEKRWKEIVLKLLKKLEIALDLNLESDALHVRQVEKQIEHMKSSLGQKDIVDAELVFALFRLCFELLGEMPDNRTRRYANKSIHFKLNSQRSLLYIQNSRQKAKTILKSSWFEPFNKHYTDDEIEDKFYNGFAFRAEDFIRWYKDTYPSLYAQLF